VDAGILASFAADAAHRPVGPYNLVDSTRRSAMSAHSIGLFEAKTHLSELVARAERGEEVIITRHSRPVAKLVPVAPEGPDAAARRAAVDALLAGARGRSLAMDWKALCDEGRA
jgi:prevent-host-death family protein